MPDKYTIDDMLRTAIDQQPSEFQNAFDSVITDAIRSRIEEKKVQIAQQMYGYEPPEDDFEEPETEEENEVEEIEDEAESDVEVEVEDELETETTDGEENG